MISNICRVEVSSELRAFLASLPAGKHAIPAELLPPRQVRIDPKKANPAGTPVTLKPHRGSLIPVLNREVAENLVRSGCASWEPQFALLYGVDDYIADKDVIADLVELARARAAKGAGEKTVFVAVIGESRSPLAVCRNIVSGCQKTERLVEDAKAAMGAAEVFLVE